MELTVFSPCMIAFAQDYRKFVGPNLIIPKLQNRHSQPRSNPPPMFSHPPLLTLPSSRTSFSPTKGIETHLSLWRTLVWVYLPRLGSTSFGGVCQTVCGRLGAYLHMLCFRDGVTRLPVLTVSGVRRTHPCQLQACECWIDVMRVAPLNFSSIVRIAICQYKWLGKLLWSTRLIMPV